MHKQAGQDLSTTCGLLMFFGPASFATYLEIFFQAIIMAVCIALHIFRSHKPCAQVVGGKEGDVSSWLQVDFAAQRLRMVGVATLPPALSCIYVLAYASVLAGGHLPPASSGEVLLLCHTHSLNDVFLSHRGSFPILRGHPVSRSFSARAGAFSSDVAMAC